MAYIVQVPLWMPFTVDGSNLQQHQHQHQQLVQQHQPVQPQLLQAPPAISVTAPMIHTQLPPTDMAREHKSQPSILSPIAESKSNLPPQLSGARLSFPNNQNIGDGLLPSSTHSADKQPDLSEPQPRQISQQPPHPPHPLPGPPHTLAGSDPRIAAHHSVSQPPQIHAIPQPYPPSCLPLNMMGQQAGFHLFQAPPAPPHGVSLPPPPPHNVNFPVVGASVPNISPLAGSSIVGQNSLVNFSGHNYPAYPPGPPNSVPFWPFDQSRLEPHKSSVHVTASSGQPQVVYTSMPQTSLDADQSESREYRSSVSSNTSSAPELDSSMSSTSSTASSSPGNSPNLPSDKLYLSPSARPSSIRLAPLRQGVETQSLPQLAELHLEQQHKHPVKNAESRPANPKGRPSGSGRIGKQPVRDPVKLKHRVWLQQNRLYQDKLHTAGFRVLEGTNGSKMCSLCFKSFAKEMFVWRHALNHVDEKPFHCTVCDQKFTRSDTLQRHVRRAGHFGASCNPA